VKLLFEVHSEFAQTRVGDYRPGTREGLNDGIAQMVAVGDGLIPKIEKRATQHCHDCWSFCFTTCKEPSVWRSTDFTVLSEVRQFPSSLNEVLRSLLIEDSGTCSGNPSLRGCRERARASLILGDLWSAILSAGERLTDQATYQSQQTQHRRARL